MFLSWSSIKAQQHTFILNAENKEVIPFATLYFKSSKIAFMSNEKGLVLIKTKIPENEIIVVEHLAFNTIEINAKNLSDTIFITANEYEINEVTINNLSAKGIIQKAINEIANNYYENDFLLKGKYLQVHKENGKYVRYIEALTDVKNEGYAPNIKMPQEESFKITALRKSFNYERNGDQHGDHFVDLFLENPIQYLENGMLNPKKLESYTWSLSQNKENNYVIHFRNNTWDSYQNIHGYVHINISDYAIVKVEIQETPNSRTNVQNKSNWEFINGWYTVSFKKMEDKYIIHDATKWYNHQVKNERNKNQIDYVVEEVFNWQTLETLNLTPSQHYSKNSNLYSLKMDYNVEKWHSFPIENIIKQDLNNKLSLEEQFEDY